MKVSVKVSIEGGKAKVEFRGVWTRRLVDIAYKNMMLKLRVHMTEMKQRIIIPETIQEERKA